MNALIKKDLEIKRLQQLLCIEEKLCDCKDQTIEALQMHINIIKRENMTFLRVVK